MPSASKTIELTDDDKRWAASVRNEIDGAIGQFVDDFVAAPFRHRVEHSLHSDLIAILRKCPSLEYGVIHVEDRHTSTLIHKEWPAQEIHEGHRRRANIDVVVLPPRSQDEAVCERDFLTGRIAACAAIEIGLDYGSDHFKEDLRKLRNVSAPMRYLIHFCRKTRTKPPDVRGSLDQMLKTDPDVQSGGLRLAAVIPDNAGTFQVLRPGKRDWQPV